MENNQPKKEKWLLPVSILIAAVLVAGAIIYNSSSGNSRETGELTANISNIVNEMDNIKDRRALLGDPDAPLTIVEFGDFQCPFCGKFFQEAGRKIREEYVKTGKVNVVSVDLAFLGKESQWAAQAAYCAGEQGSYWQYHDYIYSYLWDNYYSQGKNGENVGALSKENLKEFAGELGLNSDEFNQCLDSGRYAEKVEEGLALAKKLLGKRLSTPSIFVGKTLIQGAQPYEVFKQSIEQQLNKKIQ